LTANVATSVATPVGGLFILLLLWRKDVNEGYKAPTVLRVCMTISYVFVIIMTVSALSTYIPKLLASLGL
jgi:Mn2+/Fe2+ NRAMP family transporter